jgi:hypothetical protein
VRTTYRLVAVMGLLIPILAAIPANSAEPLSVVRLKGATYAVGDINANGTPDLASFTWDVLAPNHKFQNVFIQMDLVNGRSTKDYEIQIKGRVEEIKILDFNGDGYSDLLALSTASDSEAFLADIHSDITYFSGNQQGQLLQFQLLRDQVITDYGNTFLTGDVNGDGLDDTVMQGNGIFLGLGSKDSSITFKKVLTDDSDYIRALKDYDGDGHADLFIYHLPTASWSGTYKIASSTGNGFENPVLIPFSAGSSCELFYVFDINGDGKNDAIRYSGSTEISFGTVGVPVVTKLTAYPIASCKTPVPFGTFIDTLGNEILPFNFGTQSSSGYEWIGLGSFPSLGGVRFAPLPFSIPNPAKPEAFRIFQSKKGADPYVFVYQTGTTYVSQWALPTPMPSSQPTVTPTPAVTKMPNPTPSPKKSTSSFKSIKCVKGKTTATITGVNPKCPSGFKKK